MNQENMNKRVLMYIFLLASVVSIGIIFVATFVLHTENSSGFVSNHCNVFSQGWKLTDDSNNQKNITIPDNNLSSSSVFTIQNKLESEYEYDLTIAVYTRHQMIKVFLGDSTTPLYVFDNKNESLFTKSPGCAWNYISIPKKYYGSTIKIEYTSMADFCVGEVNTIYYGNYKGVLLHIIKNNIAGVLISVLMFGLSLVLMMVYGVVVVNNSEKIKMLYLSIFTMILSLWSLLETGIGQYFICSQEVISIISDELLMLVPIPLMLYLGENTKKLTRIIMDFATIMMCLVFIIINALCITKREEFVELISVVHMSIILAIFIVIIVAFGKYLERDMRTNEKIINSKKMGFSVFAVAVMMDMINYYRGFYYDGAACSRLGIFFFVIILGISTMEEIYTVNIMGEKIELWERYAHEDILTGVYNRNAFEEELKDIVDKQTDEDKIAIVSVDVNNLKTINDTYGHHEGDAYIKECVRAIKNVIKDTAKLYRTGGDEFVIVVKDYEYGQIMNYTSAFEKMLRNENNEYSFPISFAYGYSYFKKDVDKDVYETLKRSDKDMYNKKVEMKKNGVNIRL